MLKKIYMHKKIGLAVAALQLGVHVRLSSLVMQPSNITHDRIVVQALGKCNPHH